MELFTIINTHIIFRFFNLSGSTSPSVNAARATGIYPGQGIFNVSNSTSARGGLLDARQSFVGIINNILSQTPVVLDRASGVTTLARSQTISQNLIWYRIDNSYGIEYPLPYQYISGNNQYYKVFNSTERNNLFLNPEIISAIKNNITIKVFVDTTNSNYPAWSIWQINNSIANEYINAANGINVQSVLMEQADKIFFIAQAYNTTSDNYFDMLSLSNLTDKEYIYVDADETADGFWSIYQYNDINSQTYTTFSLSNTFSTYASMLAATSLTNGEYLYVLNDETIVPSLYSANTSAYFWSIYQYFTDTNSFVYVTSKFVILQTQAYRTTDFYNQTDWYAQNITISNIVNSYSANNYPMIKYVSESARNLAEGPNPTNIFVEINDGVNPWYWQAYDSTSASWITVALENGTIELSSEFYNPSNVVFNPAQPIVSNVAIRDGSWEIRVLADILFYEKLLENIEINETFFSILHFIHVQQTNIDWAFKTNFMTVAGYQIPLIQSGFETTDISSSLTSYIEEVKPYRVKIRNFENQYSPDIDQVNADVTDFDKPVYYDPTLKAYRRLDPNNATDLSIIESQFPDWYNEYETYLNAITNNQTPMLQFYLIELQDMKQNLVEHLVKIMTNMIHMMELH
jgi:hypothetical protein